MVKVIVLKEYPEGHNIHIVTRPPNWPTLGDKMVGMQMRAKRLCARKHFIMNVTRIFFQVQEIDIPESDFKRAYQSRKLTSGGVVVLTRSLYKVMDSVSIFIPAECCLHVI